MNIINRAVFLFYAQVFLYIVIYGVATLPHIRWWRSMIPQTTCMGTQRTGSSAILFLSFCHADKSADWQYVGVVTVLF